MHEVIVAVVRGGKHQAQCQTCSWKGNKFSDYDRAQAERYDHEQNPE